MAQDWKTLEDGENVTPENARGRRKCNTRKRQKSGKTWTKNAQRKHQTTTTTQKQHKHTKTRTNYKQLTKTLSASLTAMDS
jgi:hypothetical protein